MKFHPCHCSAVSEVYNSTRHSACNKPKRDRICDTYMLLVSVVCNKWSIFVSIWFQLDRTYMPPPPPWHLLPHILQIMPRNPKYDQFQSKGHHNEENLQSMTRVPTFDPYHEVKMVPKKENSTNWDHNLLSSEDAHVTSACKIPGHFLNGFSRKCLETPNLTHFIKSQ